MQATTDLPGRALADLTWYERCRSAPIVLGEPQSAGDRRWCTVAVSIGQGKSLFGAVFVELDVDHLVALLQRHNAATFGGAGLMTASTGRMVLGEAPDQLPTEVPVAEVFSQQAGDLTVVVPLELGDARWGIGFRVPESVAMQEVGHAVRLQLFLGGAVVCIGMLGLAWLSWRQARPIRLVARSLQAVAAGDYAQRVDASRQDEIGDLARALNTMAGVLQHKVDGVLSIDEQAQRIAGDAARLTEVAGRLSQGADSSARLAQESTATAQQVSDHVQAIASGAEEMRASIQEISQGASSALGMSDQAVTATGLASSTVIKLAANSKDIGTALQMIAAIAAQTNLLALNATIEAARAGDAGRGFSVVASEVKELARQTQQATVSITQLVTSIQSSSAEVGAAIEEVNGIIVKIREIQVTVAAAVEEQSATTQEMAQGAARAAQGSAQFTAAIGTVAQAANQASTGSRSVLDAAHGLTKVAEDMKRVVENFRA